MYRGNTGKQMSGKTTQPAATPSVPHKNTPGNGSGGAAKAGGHLMSHGERCAHASGHVLGKGGG